MIDQPLLTQTSQTHFDPLIESLTDPLNKIEIRNISEPWTFRRKERGAARDFPGPGSSAVPLRAPLLELRAELVIVSDKRNSGPCSLVFKIHQYVQLKSSKYW